MGERAPSGVMTPTGPARAYSGLMAMSPLQDRFILWLLTPKDEREPETQIELAEELGVGPTVLSGWKKDPEFLVAWNQTYLRTIGSPDTKMKIMNTLMATATDGDDPKHVQAAKTFFEIEGSLRPVKAQVDVNVSRPPSDLSDEDLKRLLEAKADDELSKRREAS